MASSVMCATPDGIQSYRTISTWRSSAGSCARPATAPTDRMNDVKIVAQAMKAMTFSLLMRRPAVR